MSEPTNEAATLKKDENFTFELFSNQNSLQEQQDLIHIIAEAFTSREILTKHMQISYEYFKDSFLPEYVAPIMKKGQSIVCRDNITGI